jgi:PAS domain S-box-containing protein
MAIIFNLWTAYKTFVDNAIQGKEKGSLKDISYWRTRLFKNFILFALPVSFIALSPAIYFGLKAGDVFIISFDVIIFILFAFVSLNKRFSIGFRKSFVAGIFFMLSIVQIAELGSFGPGVLYLMSCSVIFTVIFSTRVGYLSVLFHVFISLFFAAVIHYRLFETPLLDTYDLGSWTAYSSNIIFLSLISVLLISKIINGLENTIVNELKLRADLENQVVERANLNLSLSESRGHYKSLFNQNPSPMWVIEADTLNILRVNDAATEIYGFTEAEFLRMNVYDLRIPGNTDCIDSDFKNLYNSGKKYHYYTHHVTKDKHVFDVEIRCNPIMVQGERAVLAIGRDITEAQNYIKAIEEQNRKLHEIAYIHSHVVRAPLASIMGLVALLKMDPDGNADPEIVQQLEKSAVEFDDIITDITKNTEHMNILYRPE